ncbi:MAG: TIM barrel protein [Planctomycetota bacterium]|nr:TIM barrel protein [Planctomycetota bacterium]
MLLTLSASCIRSLVLPPGRSKKPPAVGLLDLPAFVREQLGLAGLNLSTEVLAGADRGRLESLRERADRQGCACLLLVETDAQNFGGGTDAGANAVQRLTRVVEAAHILGCSAAAVRIVASDDDESLVKVAGRLRQAVERAEKLDLNVLIAPHTGLTERPERVTELLKKVGGFRVGTFPDFESASKSKDPAAYLHRLTPYATVVSASTVEFAPGKKPGAEPSVEAFRAGAWEHRPYSLSAYVGAIRAVGYDGPLAIDYRGAGDVTQGVRLSRDALLATIGGGDPARGDEEP